MELLSLLVEKIEEEEEEEEVQRRGGVCIDFSGRSLSFFIASSRPIFFLSFCASVELSFFSPYAVLERFCLARVTLFLDTLLSITRRGSRR